MSVRNGIDWIDYEDVDEVLAIDAASYPVGWQRPDVMAQLLLCGAGAIVVRLDGDVVGYAFFRLAERRIEITRLAVHPSWRRFGVASMLIDHLVNKLGPDRRPALCLWIEEGNLIAQKFLKSVGFQGLPTASGWIRFVAFCPPEPIGSLMARSKEQRAQQRRAS